MVMAGQKLTLKLPADNLDTPLKVKFITVHVTFAN